MEGGRKVSHRHIENGVSERMTMIIWSSWEVGGDIQSWLDEMAIRITQLVKMRSSEHNHLSSDLIKVLPWSGGLAWGHFSFSI